MLTSILASDAGAVVSPTTMIDVTGVDFTSVLNEMVALLPVMLPVAVSCIAFRKGISFILSFVRGV